MEKFDIKKISEVDPVLLKDFYSHAFRYEENIANNYMWRYRNGYNNCEPIALIINDKICGHAGLIPTDLKINGVKNKAIWFTDLYIAQKYRDIGFGKILTNEWMKICPLKITICNDKSLNLFKKLKWKYNHNLKRNIKVLNYISLLPFFKNFQKSTEVLNTQDKFLEVSMVNNKILSEIIEVNNKISSRVLTGLVRDESWFKWRILECPYIKDIIIFRYKNKYLIGHILKKNSLKRINIIFSTHDMDREMLNLILTWSKKNNIDYLACIAGTKNPLKQKIYFKKSVNFSCFSDDESEINNINKLTDIQYADSDLDFI